jgi:acetoin utilization protein AcuC
MSIVMLYDEGLAQYDFGPGHPFRGDRYHVFPQFLREKLAEDDNYRMLKAEPATDDDLLLICGKDYIDFTKGYYMAAHQGLSYPGRFYRFHSGDNMPVGSPGRLEDAARLIVGQAKMACNLVQGGTCSKAVSIGGGMHHATRSYGEGFCLYNDVAFSALHLLREFDLDRILILDTDAHAGNGTAEYFYEDPRVMFIDIHQNPMTLYPGTGFAHQIGDGKGRGFTVNIPMPVGAGYDSYKLVLDYLVGPLTHEFKPQIMLRNGGSDPHFNDGLTSLGLSVRGFRMIGEKVREMAQVCEGKVIDLIASGYNKEVLPHAWLALVSGLAGIELEVEEPAPVPERFSSDFAYAETEKVLEEVQRRLKDYWRCLR